MIEVELPDGTILQFPEGTDPAVMKRAAEKYLAQNSHTPKDTVAQSGDTPGAMESFAANVAPGMTFGFADNIAAGIGSLFEDRSYNEILSGLRAQEAKHMEANPVASTLGQMTGGVLPGMGTYKAAEAGLKMAMPAINAASLPVRMGLGAATGAAEGAAYGAGTADGRDMAENVANMALIGGVAGLSAPAAVAGIGAGVRAVANPVASALNLPSASRASAAIEKMLRRAGMSADDAQRAINQAADEGQDVFRLADALGLSGQRGLAGIARQPGDQARQEIADFLAQRQAGQADRLSGFVADALDAPDTAAARAASLKEARAAAAGPAYDAARSGAGPVNLTPVIGEIDTLLKRNPILGESPLSGTEIGNRLTGIRGQLTNDTQQLVDFESVLNVKQDLGAVISNLKKDGKEVPPAMAQVYRALDAALEQSSGAYRAANDDFAKASKSILAVDKGADAVSGRVRSEDTAAAWSKMSPEEQAAFKAGYADPVIAKIDSSALGANKARPLSGGKTAKDFGFMAKDPEKIARQIERENRMFETNVMATGGSKTADNLADMKDAGIMSASVLGNLLTGNLAGAGRQALDKLMAGATGSNPATREIIAKMLLSSDAYGAIAPAVKKAASLAGPRAALEAMIRSGAIRAQ